MDLKVSFLGENILEALVKAVRAKYSLIAATDFEFAKQERNNISVPIVTEGEIILRVKF